MCPLVTVCTLNLKPYFILGGTVGLFCGLSILSVVEIFYWIFKAIVAATGVADRSRKGSA